MHLQDIRDDLLKKVGIETPANAPDYVLADVLRAVNMAGQTLNAAGDPFWILEEESYDTPDGAGAGVKAIDGHSVKSVLAADYGHALCRVFSRVELVRFHAIYLGLTDAALADAKQAPAAYFVELADDSESDDDVTVHIGPTNLDGSALLISYVPNFSAWATADLSSTTETPDVPSRYVESIFLPFARYFITRSHWFSRQDLVPGMQEDFQRAVSIMRAVNPEVDIPFADQVKALQPKEAASPSR